jgi:hypothetical protein
MQDITSTSLLLTANGRSVLSYVYYCTTRSILVIAIFPFKKGRSGFFQHCSIVSYSVMEKELISLVRTRILVDDGRASSGETAIIRLLDSSGLFFRMTTWTKVDACCYPATQDCSCERGSVVPTVFYGN